MTPLLLALALIADPPQKRAPDAPAPVAKTAPVTGAPARPVMQTATVTPDAAPAGTPAEPLVAAPRADRDTSGGSPVGNPRYTMPTDPAPQVGYAPLIAGPLPSYPGLPPGAMPMPANPTQTVGGGPLVRLFTDLKACAKGDVVTIVVTQQAVAAANAEKSSQRTVSGNFAGGTGFLKILPDFTVGWQGSTDGKSAETGNFSISTTFTAVVTDVLPNGNLEVEGQQQVYIDGKPEGVKVTGVVRPYDIASDNTVPSTSLANVKIDWTGLRAPEKQKGILKFLNNTINSLFGWLM
jgi:flagellar L-ring protein precursor FlgH